MIMYLDPQGLSKPIVNPLMLGLAAVWRHKFVTCFIAMAVFLKVLLRRSTVHVGSTVDPRYPEAP